MKYIPLPIWANDIPLKIGQTQVLWETADANANALLFSMPEGGATNVPVAIFGDTTALNADLGFFNGLTHPHIAVLDSTAAYYARFGYDGARFAFTSNKDGFAFAPPTLTTGTATDYGITIEHTLNTSSGAAGIYRGIHYNLTRTAVTGYAFEGVRLADFRLGGTSIFSVITDTDYSYSRFGSAYGSVAGFFFDETPGHSSSILAAHGTDQLVICVSSYVGNQLNLGTLHGVSGDYGHAPQPDPTIYGHSNNSPVTNPTEWWGQTHNRTDAFYTTGKGDHVFAPAGAALRVQNPNGSETRIKRATALLSGVTGASVTSSSLIPDGAFVLGVSTRITTTLGATGGTTGYQVGDGSDADRFGVASAITAGTTTDNTSATASFVGAFTAANDVVITAVGGNFDGTGAIRVVVHYIDISASTS